MTSNLVSEYNFKNYLSFDRFTSYFTQIKEVLNSGCKTCGIVGIGDSLVPTYLKSQGIQVTTIDIDPMLSPDIQCSVTDLTKVQEVVGNFDVVLCCQVLEHLPFEKFAHTLNQLKKIALKKLIISLPDSRRYYFFNFSLPKLHNLHFGFTLQLNEKNYEAGGEHFWEIGWKGYPFRLIKNEFSKQFKEYYSYRNKYFPYHNFFIISLR